METQEDERKGVERLRNTHIAPLPAWPRGEGAGEGFNVWPVAALVMLAVLLLAPLDHALAAGIVGDGTPESCTEAALDAALADGGAVTFDCGSGPLTITVTRRKTIGADTTIDGGNLITISGENRVGVFSVETGVAFTVQNLTIANGSGSPGGGINNTAGELTVSNCTFVGNRSSRSVGGAIASSYGRLTVSSSTFAGNTAGIEGCGPDSGCEIGGAIFVAGDGATRVVVTNSTFTDNSAFAGGGIAALDFTPEGSLAVTVTNTSFTGNSASGPGGDLSGGGAIINFGTMLTLTNSTIATNSADFGGGVANYGMLMVSNSVIADSVVGGDCFNGVDAVADGGHNLIEDAENACGLTNGVNDNIVGVDPLLDPAGLQDNGGSTQTIALLPDSPAIDAGDPEVCANPPVNRLDQRGYMRPGQGSTACSIGAYEYDASELPLCDGDCNGDGVITVDEVITGVNIALGNISVCECMPCDTDEDGTISIAEIIRAVHLALTGCPFWNGEGGDQQASAAVWVEAMRTRCEEQKSLPTHPY